MYDISLNDTELTFKELEKKIYKMACNEACNVEYSRRIYQFKLESGKKASKYLLEKQLKI